MSVPKRIVTLLVVTLMIIGSIPLASVTALAKDFGGSPAAPEIAGEENPPIDMAKAAAGGIKNLPGGITAHMEAADTVVQGSTAGEDGANLEYELVNDSYIRITKYTGSGEVVIPEEIDGYAVKELGSSVFEGNTGITRVTLPATVETIGNSAFKDCAGLKTVELPEGLKSIGNYGFYGCAALTAVSLPDSIETMGMYAFGDCTGLSEINYPKGLKNAKNSIFSGCTSLKSMTVPEGVTELAAYTFNFAEVETVILPSTLKSIGSGAFYYCEKLTEIALPEGLETIGVDAFRNCSALEKLTLPATVTAISNSVFMDCTGLKTVELPEGLKSIGNYGFYGCAALTAVNLPDGIETMGMYAFGNCTGLSEINYPKGLKSAETSIFSGCTSLKSMTVPEGVTELAANVFSFAEIEAVILPTTLKSIEKGAFQYCEKLTGITLPEGLETIGEEAFRNCTALEKIALPATVETIGNSAFMDCTGLKTVELPEGLKGIGNYGFYGCAALTAVSLPDSVETMGMSAFGNCTGLLEINYPKGLKTAGTSIFTGCTSLKGMTVPEGVTELAANVFCGAEFESVILPSTLKSIGGSAFEDSKINRIAVPAAVTHIGALAFYNCQELSTAIISGTRCVIENGAFDLCPKLVMYTKPISEATLYAIMNGKTFRPLEVGENDYSDYIVDMKKTDFYTTANIAQLKKYVPLTLNYCIDETQAENASDMKLIINMTQNLELTEYAILLNGQRVEDYTYSDNRIVIPVTEKTGTVQFSVTPVEEGISALFAQMEYSRDGDLNNDLIGIVYFDAPLIKLDIPDQVSGDTIDVSGVAGGGETVRISINGTYVDSVKAKLDGTYAKRISLPETLEDGSVNTAEAALESNSDVKAVEEFVYDDGAPVLTQFDMYLDSQKVDLMNTRGERLTNRLTPGDPFKFVIGFSNYEKLGSVYVASTKNGITKMMPAKPTEKGGEYIAEGFFEDAEETYIPGTVNVYFTTVVTKEEISQPLTMEELPDIWKNSTVNVVNDEEDSFDAEITLDGGATVEVGSETTTIQELRETLLGEEPGEAATEKSDGIAVYDGGSELLDAFIKLGLDLGKSYGKKVITNGHDVIVLNNEQENKFQYIFFDSATEAIKTTSIKYGSALSLYSANELYWNGFMWDKGSWDSCLTVAKAGYDQVKAAIHAYDDIVSLDKARSAVESSGLSEAEKQQMLENIDQVQWVALALDAYRLTKPILDLAVKSAATAAFGPVGAFAATFLFDTVSDLILNTIDNKISGYLEYCKAGGQGSFLKWLIDPSGYVYEGVTTNRLPGVKTTVYYIPYDENDAEYWDSPKTENAILWDAQEYSQINPLYTDDYGCYAWDVPEGWWQVKYELESYETAYSEWLPVPPPQTSVNIGLVSTEAPQVQSAEITENGIVVTFSQYMNPETITGVTLTGKDGASVPYTVEYSKEEKSADGTVYARVFTLVPDSTEDAAKLTVPGTVLNYAGRGVSEYEQEFGTLLGDANGDGVVDSLDAVEILRFYAGVAGSEINMAAADVDKNGKVDSNDAVAVLRIYAGLASAA